MKKLVLTYGTFDLFHAGHLSLLNRLKAMGDELVVGVTTDEFNATRGKRTLIGFADRIEIVRNLRAVDRTIAFSNREQKVDDIQRLGVSIFGMGSDWTGRFDDLRAYCEVVYLPRTEHISSTLIRNALVALAGDPIGEHRAGLARMSPIPSPFDGRPDSGDER